MHIFIFSELVIKQCSTKQLFCTSGQNLCKVTAKEIIFSKVADLSYDKVWNSTKEKLLHRCFSIFLTTDESQNKTLLNFLLVCLLACLLVGLFSCLLACWLVDLFTYLFIYLFTYLLTYLLIYLLTYLLTYLLIYLLTY